MELPNNRKAELGVIGACLAGGMETTVEAAELIELKAFFYEDVRNAFEILLGLIQSGLEPDMVSFGAAWLKTPLGCLLASNSTALNKWSTIPEDILTSVDDFGKWHLKQSAAETFDLYQRRKAMLSGDQLLLDAQDLNKPIEESVAECQFSMLAQEAKTPPTLEPKQTALNLSHELERLHGLQGALSGIGTGFNRLDEATQGFQRGEFWVIAARPGAGKTSIALNMAEHTAFTLKVPTMIVSLEMSANALGKRLLSMNAEINMGTIRKGSFSQQDFDKMARFNIRLSNSPLYITDAPGGMSASRVVNAVRTAVRRFGVQIVFLDYLQKVRPDEKGEKRTYEIGESNARLVELTKRENICMVALAQLNRENDKQKRPPIVSDIADSKSIEADADFIGLLDRPVDGDERKARLIIGKQRDGERGIIPLVFQGWHCRFRDGHHPDVQE